MNYEAFFTFVLTSTITPGPNNIMAMVIAGKYGLKNSLKCTLGYVFGNLIVASVTGLFSASLLTMIPQFQPFMLVFGTLYMLWLAWHVWRDSDPISENTQANNEVSIPAVNQSNESKGAGTGLEMPVVGTESVKTSAFFVRRGITLTLINVKIIIYMITVWSSFLLPNIESKAAFIGWLAFLSLLGPFVSSMWAVLGSVLSKVFSEHGKKINAVMAIALVYCAYTMIAGLF